jgi:hypothetical protein
MLRGDLESIEHAAFDQDLPEESDSPGLATLMLMRRLFARDAMQSLLDVPTIRVPWSRSRVAAIAAAACVGGIFTVSGFADTRAFLAARNTAALVGSECAHVELRLAKAEAIAGAAVASRAVDSRLEFALSMRRPVSRLIAEISNGATDAVHIEVLQFSSTEKASLSGVVKGGDRQHALAELTRFVNCLRALPYFEPGGDDEVAEVPGQPDCLRFRLDMAWSKSCAASRSAGSSPASCLPRPGCKWDSPVRPSSRDRAPSATSRPSLSAAKSSKHGSRLPSR